MRSSCEKGELLTTHGGATAAPSTRQLCTAGAVGKWCFNTAGKHRVLSLKSSQV